MFVYDLATSATYKAPHGTIDHSSESRDSIQINGDVVVAVLPFEIADTFNKTTLVSRDIVPNRVVTPIFLDPFALSVGTTHTKESHQGTLTVDFLDPPDDILSKISPGDWVVCWMFSNKQQGDKFRKELQDSLTQTQGFPKANGSDSGLKFLGKVFSIRRNLRISGDGKRVRRNQLIGTSFSELDSTIYFDPFLTENLLGGMSWFKSVIAFGKQGLYDVSQIDRVLARSIAAFLGGVFDETKTPTTPIFVPVMVAQILGKKGDDNQYSVKYLDFLHTYIGIQKFSDSYMSDLIRPAGPLTYPTIQFNGLSIEGAINPVVQPFNNVPIWGIIQNFSNNAINEAYTALRANEQGDIVPTLTIRQVPFSSDEYASRNRQSTPFRSLPAWRVDDSLITNVDIGKSESTRTNFVRIIPNPVDFGGRYLTGASLAEQSTPIADSIDHQRHGLRATIRSVNTVFNVRQVKADVKRWNSVIADRNMGSQLKLSGSMALRGIHEPICVGDNLIYENMLYHIEQVMHKVMVDSTTGSKIFLTQLSFSNGVPLVSGDFPEIVNHTEPPTENTGWTRQSNTFEKDS